MKKIRQILALLGALLLFAMYGCTLVFALSGSRNALPLLKASIACTVIVPVFLYANILVFRLLKGRGKEDISDDSDDR